MSAGQEADGESSPHELVNPDGMPPPIGFSHAVVAAEGRTVFLSGQTAHDQSGEVRGEGVVQQLRYACTNVARALEEVGGAPGDLVLVQLLTTDMHAYRAEQSEIGDIWRETFGHHYPAMAAYEVSALVDPEAVVELLATAVIA